MWILLQCTRMTIRLDSLEESEALKMCWVARETVQYDTDDNMFANDIQHCEQSESICNTCAVETVDYDKLERKLNETLGLLAKKEIDIKKGLKVKAYEISVVKEKHDELVKQSLLTKGLVKEKTKVITDLKLKEEKDIDKMISMENQLKFLNEIVYKRSQSIQTIHMLAPKCHTFNGRPTFANLMYLKKAQNEIPCLYAIPHDQSDPANRLVPDREETLTLDNDSRSKLNKDLVKHFDYTKLNNEITELQCLYLHKVRECDCLAQKLSEQTEFVSKEIYTELLRSFAKLEKHSISLEIALQQCQEQLKNDTVCKEKASNVFRKEREQYFEIQDLKAQLQDKNIAISELKKLIEKCKGKSVDTKFDKPSVVRQPNAQRIPKPSVLGKPAPFSDSLERTNFAKKKSVSKTNESEGLSKPVTPQNLPQTATQAVSNINVIKPGMYRIASSTTQTRAPQLTQTSRNTNPRVSTSTGVAHKTNVSRPQPRSNQMKDKVMPNTSHVKFKKTKVQEHPRISSISNQTKSVTACNDSLNSKTLNVNAVCATYGKCVFNSNHDAYVSKFLNNVNARTKRPKIVQLILFIVDSGCTKHMTGNLSLLCNFVEKYLGTVRFGNDQFAPILGYGDLVQGNITINRVYYVEGLNHNLFSVGQFCDADLEVAFRKSTCFVRDLQGNDLLIGNRGTDLYTISLQETTSSQTSRNTNPRVSTSTGVAHRTNVSRPQPRSNQMKDKVLPNTSQVKFKKTEVEDHPRISSISNQTKSVTACNDSLNSRTSNVNVVCATCGKCVFNSNHDACVSKFLNDVNARTKKPNVVPISTRKPKSQANKSVATPHKKTAASESTTTNSKSYYRMLYKKTSKAWKWWIAQQCPSAYKWIVQPILFIVDSGWTKHMTGKLSLLCNFVEKYLGTVRFGNDQFAPILGYGDLVQGNITINRVYYVKGLNHNLFSVGQFYDADLEVAFRKSTCFVRDLQGNDLLIGRLNLLHMDLCGPMRVASINGKRYILVIVDDYSRYTWILFLRSKDETPKVLKNFLTMIQRNLQAPVISVRTDRGTEFLNKTLNAFFKEEGIEHQTSTPRTPEQNGVVERRNRTLVEAARTMLSAFKLPLFFWAEAIATACYTQNRSIIIPTHEKMAYHIINDRKPSIKHLHIFGCTCYLTRDGENLDKMKEKGDPCILVGYSTQSKGYRVYNKRTRLIVESIHLKFDEIKEMSETSVANDTSGLVPQRQKASDYDNPDPVPEL
ncbi:retrovirus-related pol polyprotein from transposon TNT 1-94 [Tanacetum coccineum]|uniref:Retrovirus-related pol polyprotein from transposon TNT 1-94 n=1 Tax=Tanacetum coccineum TaxID=301880 RepID=A0ABQ4ZIM2_9ASTR